MSSSEKIKKLKQQIINIQLKPFEYWLNEVISICESDIEKQMFLQLIYHIQATLREGNIMGENYLSQEIGFIPKYYNNDSTEHLEKDLKKEFNYDGYNYFKMVGVKVNYGIERSKQKRDKDGKLTLGVRLSSDKDFYHSIKIIPQYEVSIDKNNPNIDINFNPRVDIAFILERIDISDNTVVETRKLAVECDGYEFHKNSYKKDQIRSRAIKQSGFRDVLRYSGSEIYKTSEDDKRIHYNFRQLMNIIMI